MPWMSRLAYTATPSSYDSTSPARTFSRTGVSASSVMCNTESLIAGEVYGAACRASNLRGRIESCRMHDPAHQTLACGRCGFPAARLTDFTCPRCKSDVRETGIGRDD